MMQIANLFSSSRSLVFKMMLMCIGFILTPYHIYAQGVSPEVQLRIDSLNKWVQMQLKTTGAIDQKKLDSLNADIRLFQQEEKKNAKEDRTGKQSSAEKIISKQGMVGTTFSVPSSRIWKVKRVFVSDNGGHNILVTSVRFPSEYHAGEKINVPAWTAESNLLGADMGSLNYIFEIIESEIIK